MWWKRRFFSKRLDLTTPPDPTTKQTKSSNHHVSWPSSETFVFVAEGDFFAYFSYIFLVQAMSPGTSLSVPTMPKSNCVPFRTSPEKLSPDRTSSGEKKQNGDIVSCGCDCCGWFGVDFSWEVMICWVLVDTPTKTGWWNVSYFRKFQSWCLNRAWFLPLLQKNVHEK